MLLHLLQDILLPLDNDLIPDWTVVQVLDYLEICFVSVGEANKRGPLSIKGHDSVADCVGLHHDNVAISNLQPLR